jgi:hypothetical protein
MAGASAIGLVLADSAGLLVRPPGAYAVSWCFPLTSRPAITSGFGNISPPYYSPSTPHSGTDWGATYDDGIYAAAAGTVSDRDDNHGHYGNTVTIDHGTSGGYNWKTLYAHMNAAAEVGSGASVVAGQLLGHVGGTQGVNSPLLAPHLHVSMFRDDILVNPATYLQTAPLAVPGGAGPDEEEEEMHIIYAVEEGHDGASDPWYMFLGDGRYRVITRTEFYLRRKNPYNPDGDKKKVNTLSTADLTALIAAHTLIS